MPGNANSGRKSSAQEHTELVRKIAYIEEQKREELKKKDKFYKEQKERLDEQLKEKKKIIDEQNKLLYELKYEQAKKIKEQESELKKEKEEKEKLKKGIEKYQKDVGEYTSTSKYKGTDKTVTKKFAIENKAVEGAMKDISTKVHGSKKNVTLKKVYDENKEDEPIAATVVGKK